MIGARHRKEMDEYGRSRNRSAAALNLRADSRSPETSCVLFTIRGDYPDLWSFGGGLEGLDFAVTTTMYDCERDYATIRSSFGPVRGDAVRRRLAALRMSVTAENAFF